MKKQLIIVSALLLITCVSSAQKKFTINVYGGYSLPVADLYGKFPDTLGNSFLDFRKSRTLLTKTGVNFGTQVKFAVDSIGSQRISAGVNYSSFSGSMDYPRPSGLTQTYKNKVSIITLNAGLEYALNPSRKFIPFLGLDISANFFGGKVEASGDTIYTQSRKTETRFGVTATAGLEMRLWKSSGLVAGVKYGLTNLIGRSSEIIATTTNNPNLDEEEQGSTSTNELPLNDKVTSSWPDKSINYVQFFVGVSIYFGHKLGKK